MHYSDSDFRLLALEQSDIDKWSTRFQRSTSQLLFLISDAYQTNGKKWYETTRALVSRAHIVGTVGSIYCTNWHWWEVPWTLLFDIIPVTQSKYFVFKSHLKKKNLLVVLLSQNNVCCLCNILKNNFHNVDTSLYSCVRAMSAIK